MNRSISWTIGSLLRALTRKARWTRRTAPGTQYTTHARPSVSMPRLRQRYQNSDPPWLAEVGPSHPSLILPPSPSWSPRSIHHRSHTYQRFQLQMPWRPVGLISTLFAASPASRPRPLKTCPITCVSTRPRHIASANCHLCKPDVHGRARLALGGTTSVALGS